MTVIEIILTIGLIAVVIAYIIHSLRMDPKKTISDPLQKASLDLTERMIKTSSEMKEAIDSRFYKEFTSLGEKLENSLRTGRQEQDSKFTQVTGEMEKKLESIKNTMDQKLLSIGDQVQEKLDKNIKEGFMHFEKVQEHLKKAEDELQTLNTIGSSVNELNSILRLPHLRGNFGEACLENLLSDLLPADAFELQKNLGNGERVDAVVNFPKGVLPIDSKFPREQVLALFDTSEPAKLESARTELSRVIKDQAKSIHDKYIKPESGTLDMALMFLASETLYFEVIREVELRERLTKLKVFPVSPNTLAITLKSISIAREYYDMSQNVEKTIKEIKKARMHFGNFENKFEAVGDGLKKSQDAFSKASTHLSHYSSAVTRLTGEKQQELEPDEKE
ncbi:DNA recombination protein RmuC [Elusimicrobiota bacterium]